MPCTSCSLHKDARTNCLQGRGPKTTDLMFIGEAPGEDDDLRGQPFVGPSGEVLDYLLLNAGVNRDNVWVTNTAKCRPINKESFWNDRHGVQHFANRNPSVLESYTCATKFLEGEIKAAHPKVIVAMGNVACEYLFGKYSLLPDGSLQKDKKDKIAIVNRVPEMGSLIYGDYWDPTRNLWIVPMYHPAFVLRSQDYFVMMVELIKKAALIAKNGPGTEKTNCFVATNFDDAIALLRRAAENKVLAYDHETTGLDWRFEKLLNMGFSWKEGTGASVRLLDNTGAPLYSPDQVKVIYEEARKIFQDPEKILIGYNDPFDSSWTEAKLGYSIKAQRHDVQVLYHALNSIATHKKQSLETLTWLYTAMANYKDESKPWFDKKKFLECPVEVMSRRNCGDVDATLRLYNRFRPKVAQSSIAEHYDNFIQHLPEFSKTLNINGANVGLERLREMRDRIEEASDELAGEFLRGVNAPETVLNSKGKPQKFNPRSSTHLAHILFEILGLPIIERTPTGKPRTSEYVLDQLSKTCAALKPLMEYKKLQKLLGTYVLGLRGWALFGNSKKKKPDIWSIDEAKALGFDTDGRVHPTFSIVGTVTGRPSVSKPNTANQPRPTDQQRRLGVVLRQAFEAPKGSWILERDMSQAELRFLAGFSGDKVLLEAINSKEGVHKRTASFLYRVPVEQVTKEFKDQAKTIVFAIIYGGSAYTIEDQISELLDNELKRRYRMSLEAAHDPDIEAKMKEFVTSRDDRMELAEEFINTWRAQYLVAAQWIDAQKRFVRDNGYVISFFGRVYRFPLIFSNNRKLQAECERAAVNYLIQGPATEATYMAGLRCQKEIQRLGLKSKIINFVYDALFFEVPDEELEQMKELTRVEMERDIPGLPVNMFSEVEVGRCWKEEAPEKDLIRKLEQVEDEEVEEEEDATEEEVAA